VFYGEKENFFTYYEDDGVSYEYEKNDFFLQKWTFKGKEKKIIFEKNEGNRKSKFYTYQVFLHHFPDTLKEVIINKQSIVLQEKNFAWLPELHYENVSKNTKNFTIKNKGEKIEISF
jgi:alpha-glucosidase